jgi:hypothetical protein
MPFFLAAKVGLGFSCLQNIRRDNPSTGVWQKAMWILLLVTLLIQSTGIRRQLNLAYVDSSFSIFTTLALPGWILALIYLGIGVGLWIFGAYKGKHLINAPGWVCEVNGKETKIISVYNAFRGVPISAGHNRVIFRYLPTYTYVGFGLSLLGVLMTGVWCMILKNAAWRG